MPSRDRMPGGRALGSRAGGVGRAWGLRLTDPKTGQTFDLGSLGTPFLYGTGPVTLPGVGRVNIRLQSKSSFLITSVRGRESVTNATSIKITDPGRGRDWQDRACLLSLIAGDGRFPYVLPTPVLVRPVNNVSPVLAVDFADVGGAGVVADLVFEGIKLPGALSPAVVELLEREQVFFYSLSHAIAAGSGTGTGASNVQLQDDASFELHDINAYPRTAYGITEIKAVASAESYSNVEVRAEDLLGDGQRPGHFSKPLVLDPGETLSYKTLNRQAGGQTVEMVFAGVKVFGR